jgi:prolyl 4-hydroxylase
MQPPQTVLADAIDLAQAGREAEAVAIIERLAAERDPEAMFLLADLHWRGSDVVKQDFARGRFLFWKASHAGHPIATRAYTNLLANGIAGPADWPRAIDRLREEARVDTRRAHMLALVEAMDLDEAGDPRRIPVGRRLSEAPLVTLFERAFSPAECDFLRLVAEPTYMESLVKSASGKDVRDTIRTSDGSTIHWLIEDPAVHALNRRLAALSGTRVEQGEALQILRYLPGQQYHPHVDWLGESNARILTALIYLNDDYAGGETGFVETGLKVKGRKGDALVFSSVDPQGRFDPLSEHAGLPVTRGVKYLASRWIRANRHAA